MTLLQLFCKSITNWHIDCKLSLQIWSYEGEDHIGYHIMSALRAGTNQQLLVVGNDFHVIMTNFQDQINLVLSWKPWRSAHFHHALSEIIAVPFLAAWLPPRHDVELSSVAVQEKTCPTSFRHTSDTEMSHCVSPSRVSWFFATLQRLSPACCVCPLEEKMKQFLTIISKAQTQVRTNHMQTHWPHTFSFCVWPFVWQAVTLSLCHFWQLFYDLVCPLTLTRPDT